MTCIVSCRPKNGTGPFLNSLIAPRFYNTKRVFLAVNASLRWLNNVSNVYLVQGFLASYWSAGFGTFLFINAQRYLSS
jgi:hypothetical protein